MLNFIHRPFHSNFWDQWLIKIDCCNYLAKFPFSMLNSLPHAILFLCKAIRPPSLSNISSPRQINTCSWSNSYLLGRIYYSLDCNSIVGANPFLLGTFPTSLDEYISSWVNLFLSLDVLLASGSIHLFVGHGGFPTDHKHPLRQPLLQVNCGKTIRRLYGLYIPLGGVSYSFFWLIVELEWIGMGLQSL